MFITFEGPDGSGKTSISKIVVERLQKEGYKVMLTREPGGNKIAEQIRNIILDKENTALDPKAEALLYAASRRQHLIEKVLPAIKRGEIVICDRFIDSSLAYQGGGRNLGVEEILQLNLFATDNIFPDLTLFFDISPEEGLQRLNHDTKRVVDRLDLESKAFHEKVYETFLDLTNRYKDRYVVINARKSIEEVAEATYQAIIKKLNENKWVFTKISTYPL